MNLNFANRIISRLWKVVEAVLNLDKRLDELKINQGTLIAIINRNKNTNNIKNYEFKVFSQWGEDGIIQHLIDSIEIKNKTFIEFGVEDFFESNCRFLMMKDD